MNTDNALPVDGLSFTGNIFLPCCRGLSFSVDSRGILPLIAQRRGIAMTENQKMQIIKLRASGNGYGKIAKTLGISLNTIKSFCRRHNINGNAVVESLAPCCGETARCENCGREIHQIAKQKKRRFCCDKCRNVWWNAHLDRVKRKAIYDFRCLHCGKVFRIYGDRRRKYCSHKCYISDRFKVGVSDA